MSELINQLKDHAEANKGTDLGRVLQWAMMHIAEQDEALSDARSELDEEQSERIKMERAIHEARIALSEVSNALDCSRPINIELTRDHVPHINRMAAAGVAPYAKKTRKKKE